MWCGECGQVNLVEVDQRNSDPFSKNGFTSFSGPALLAARWLMFGWLISLMMIRSSPVAAPQSGLERADQLYSTGHYQEAAELYAGNAESQSAAMLGLARILCGAGQADEARSTAESTLNGNEPDPELLALVADFAVRAEDYKRAASLLKLGSAEFPLNARWMAELARVYELVGQRQELSMTLEQVVKRNDDNLSARKKLLQMALENKDYPAAVRWANECLTVDVKEIEGACPACPGKRGVGAACRSYGWVYSRDSFGSNSQRMVISAV